MSVNSPSAAEYSRITPELMRLTDLWADHAHIDKELYQKYSVKRGLRDANGRGVLASLTRISESRATLWMTTTPSPVRVCCTTAGTTCGIW